MLLNRTLTSAEVDFVFFHLAHHLDGFEQLKPFIQYGSDSSLSGMVVFPVSDQGIDLSGSVVVDDVPVIFPLSANGPLYDFQDGTLVFRHDLIKSAFYFLSGYQEWAQPQLNDQWQRFPFDRSVQHQLGVIHKPVVNYYFEWMIDGLCRYAGCHQITIGKRLPFGRMGLHLSHDIDLVRYHAWRKIVYRMAQLIGLRTVQIPRLRLLKSVLRSVVMKMHLMPMENPYWSFSKILNTERYFGFRSSWFFLQRDGSPFDADYHWHDADVRVMILNLQSLGQEIGLHGSLKSAGDYRQFSSSYLSLSQLLDQKPLGVRMHFLSMKFPDCFRDFDRCGVAFDCSLGFSRMEGFRFGYCFPFRPYDHERAQMVSTWELPLVAMDTTLLVHRGLSYDGAYHQFEILLEEVNRFHGVFSLLIHNSTFDECEHPGFLKFYEGLHHYLSQYSPTSLTGAEIIEHISSETR